MIFIKNIFKKWLQKLKPLKKPIKVLEKEKVETPTPTNGNTDIECAVFTNIFI